MTTLLLVRHGQSTWNAEGRWQGQADPPLSDLGRRQGAWAAERLGGIDVIASSPQLRARETAEIIGERLGVGPVVLVADLRERNAGPWSGLTGIEIDARWPGWRESGHRPDGFEAETDLVVRTESALRDVVASHPGSTVLVVCHGGVIHSFERTHGVVAGRVPNLAGRRVRATSHGWEVGPSITLLDEAVASGGDPNRL